MKLGLYGSLANSWSHLFVFLAPSLSLTVSTDGLISIGGRIITIEFIDRQYPMTPCAFLFVLGFVHLLRRLVRCLHIRILAAFALAIGYRHLYHLPIRCNVHPFADFVDRHIAIMRSSILNGCSPAGPLAIKHCDAMGHGQHF